jgi:hypothetical protein
LWACPLYVHVTDCLIAFPENPEQPAQAPVPTENETAGPPTVHGTAISEQDRVLLLRVKWLLGRFHDSLHQAESDAHTKSSIELMRDAQELQHKNALASQMQTAEALVGASSSNNGKSCCTFHQRTGDLSALRAAVNSNLRALKRTVSSSVAI